MASIHREIPIAAHPDDVWSAVRDFGAVHTRLVPTFRSSCSIAAPTFHELRKVMGTSKPMILVPLFLFEVPGQNLPLVVQELQIGGTSAGLRNRHAARRRRAHRDLPQRHGRARAIGRLRRQSQTAGLRHRRRTREAL